VLGDSAAKNDDNEDSKKPLTNTRKVVWKEGINKHKRHTYVKDAFQICKGSFIAELVCLFTNGNFHVIAFFS